MPKKPTDKSKEIDYQQECFKRQYEDSKRRDAYLDEIRKIPNRLFGKAGSAGEKIAKTLQAIIQPNQTQPTVTTSPDGCKTTIHIPGVQGKMKTVGDLQRQLMGQATPEARNTVSKPQEIYYDGREGILFVDKAHTKLTHTEKVFFEYFWSKEESVNVDSVIDHMTTLSELKGTAWDIRYFNKTKSIINKKCKGLGITMLIRNVAKKENKLSIKVKKKIFKS